MRELDPQTAPPCAVVGAGRLGTALAAALGAPRPLKRGEPIPPGAEVVLLCVPDGEIAAAAAAVPPGPLVGHCSGATGLEPLGAREGFSLHPLMSVPAGSGPEVLRGAGAAVDGSTPRALAVATALAEKAGLKPAHVAPEDRAAYHAAAAMASNFLVTLEGAAERLAAPTGVTRDLLAPLVQAAAAQWAALGAERALTGPIARGDRATVARQRAAVAERAPDLIPLWDALADATAELAGRTVAP
ncbi:MAG TPA: DUF2520 domain-containing protein [Solirubrobacteraceae bacterium]|jgi:predicted short-subunit dehydrogenase-like oxidoreductase (DUF2520 family)